VKSPSPIVALAVAAMAGCSSSSGSDAGPTSAAQTPGGSSSSGPSSSRTAPGVVACSKLAGEPVPASLDDATCSQPGVADVAKQSYPCSGGGLYFWISPESASGSDLAPYVGRPGKTWVKGSTSASIDQLAQLVGC
jgi:hypothetical protein